MNKLICKLEVIEQDPNDYKELIDKGWQLWDENEPPNTDINLKLFDFISFGTMLLFKEKAN